MTKQTSARYSPEVRARVGRMALEHQGDYPSKIFRCLKRNEIDRYGEYRTQRLVLAAFDKLTGA